MLNTQTMKTLTFLRLFFALLWIVALRSPVQAAPPDLTLKDVSSAHRRLTYNLGATGLRGWIYTKAEDNLDAAQAAPRRPAGRSSSPMSARILRPMGW